jgi:hypothetical protein
MASGTNRTHPATTLNRVLPFPCESYMRALAEALYAVSYVESMLLGDLPRLSTSIDSLSVEGLSRQTMGAVASSVRQAISRASTPGEAAWLAAAADALESVVDLRNRVVHAHPATVDGQQMLYRWATAKGTKPHEAHAITETDLVALRDLAYEQVRRLNAVRLPVAGVETP